MSDWLTVAQVAEQIGMTEDYVARQCKAGVLKGKKLGNQWRVHVASLEAFMLDDTPAPPTRQRLSARQQRRSA